MQFKELSALDYHKVCRGIESKATGLTVCVGGIEIKRSGARLFFMFEMLNQIIIEKNFVEFMMGTRPYCNIRLALKNMQPWEQSELYKRVMEK